MPKRFVEITFDLGPVMPSSLGSLLISTSIEQEDDLSSRSAVGPRGARIFAETLTRTARVIAPIRSPLRLTDFSHDGPVSRRFDQTVAKAAFIREFIVMHSAEHD